MYISNIARIEIENDHDKDVFAKILKIALLKIEETQTEVMRQTGMHRKLGLFGCEIKKGVDMAKNIISTLGIDIDDIDLGYNAHLSANYLGAVKRSNSLVPVAKSKPDWIPDEVFIVVSKNDIPSGIYSTVDENGPIIFETYLKDTSILSASDRLSYISGHLGESYIAKLEFIGMGKSND